MQETGYETFSFYYDALTENVDYPARAAYLDGLVQKYLRSGGKVMLDLACGTGTLTEEMAKRGYITVDKGSVTVNGVSLTVCNPTDDTFQVAIIPYTYEHTNFHTFEIGSVVNIEFDIIGKYISRMIQYK